MLALIKDNTVISQVPSGRSFYLHNGDRVSPAVEGWSNTEGYWLAKIVDADPIPDGKQSTGHTVEIVNGSPKRVPILEDIPPPSTDPNDYPLNPAQFEAILSIIGITVEQIDAAIDVALSDPVDNAFAKAKVRKSTSYSRGNHLFALLSPVMGISDAEIDAAWLQAKDLH